MSESFFDSLNFGAGRGASPSSQALLNGAPMQSQAIVFWKRDSPSPSLQSALGAQGAPTDVGGSRGPPSPALRHGKLDVLDSNVLHPTSPTLRRSPRKAAAAESPKAAGKRRALDLDIEMDTSTGSARNTAASSGRRIRQARPSKRSRQSRGASSTNRDGRSDSASMDASDSGKFIAYVNQQLFAGLSGDLEAAKPDTPESLKAAASARPTVSRESSGIRRHSSSRAGTEPPPGSDEPVDEDPRHGPKAKGIEDASAEDRRTPAKSWLRHHTDPHPRLSSPHIEIHQPIAAPRPLRQSPRKSVAAARAPPPAAPLPSQGSASSARSMSRTTSKASTARTSVSPVKQSQRLGLRASVSPAKQPPQRAASRGGSISPRKSLSSRATTPQGSALAGSTALAGSGSSTRRSLGSTARHFSSGTAAGPTGAFKAPVPTRSATAAAANGNATAKRTPLHVSRSPKRAPGSSPASAIVIEDDGGSDGGDGKAEDSFDFAEDEEFILLSERLAEEGF